MDADLIERRRSLVATLRAETYDKATGGLCVRDSHYDEDQDEETYTTLGFCCIGVALKSGVYLDDDRLSGDDPEDYDTFMEKYEVSEHLKEYLVAMNDGDGRPSPGYQDNDTERSHPFIARFLEIAWKLGS